MRIITGTAKGCHLKAPKGMTTRPTTDRVKESLFNILRNDIYDAMVLDIFAGTGNLGLEALSRGAVRAVFVDKNAESIKVINDNAQHTRLNDRSIIYKMDVFMAIQRLARQGKKFDLIFCDPPYSKGLVQQVLLQMETAPILAADGILVIEHDKGDIITEATERLVCVRSEKYGATCISFFKWNSLQQDGNTEE